MLQTQNRTAPRGMIAALRMDWKRHRRDGIKPAELGSSRVCKGAGRRGCLRAMLRAQALSGMRTPRQNPPRSPIAPRPGAVLSRICFLPLLLLTGTRVVWQRDGDNPNHALGWPQLCPMAKSCSAVVSSPSTQSHRLVCALCDPGHVFFFHGDFWGRGVLLPVKSRESWSVRRGGCARRGHRVWCPRRELSRASRQPGHPFPAKQIGMLASHQQPGVGSF